MKIWIGLILSCSGFAFGKTVTAEINATYADICFVKQVSLQNYASATLVGKCAMETFSMFGMELLLTSLTSGDSPVPHLISLGGNINEILLVEQKEGQLQISVNRNDIDIDTGEYVVRKEVIYVKSINSEERSFSVHTKEYCCSPHSPVWSQTSYF